MNTQLAYQAALKSPSIMRHLAANFYDLLLIFAISCALTAVFLAFKTQFIASQALAEFSLTSAERNALQLLLASGIYVFYIYFWVVHGKTLGMQTWKLVLVRSQQPAAVATTQTR